jgi:hypothetical protein
MIYLITEGKNIYALIEVNYSIDLKFLFRYFKDLVERSIALEKNKLYEKLAPGIENPTIYHCFINFLREEYEVKIIDFQIFSEEKLNGPLYNA